MRVVVAVLMLLTPSVVQMKRITLCSTTRGPDHLSGRRVALCLRLRLWPKRWYCPCFPLTRSHERVAWCLASDMPSGLRAELIEFFRESVDSLDKVGGLATTLVLVVPTEVHLGVALRCLDAVNCVRVLLVAATTTGAGRRHLAFLGRGLRAGTTRMMICDGERAPKGTKHEACACACVQRTIPAHTHRLELLESSYTIWYQYPCCRCLCCRPVS